MKKLKLEKEERIDIPFFGASYFKRMQELGLYTIDKDEIAERVKKLNLDNIFEQKLV